MHLTPLLPLLVSLATLPWTFAQRADENLTTQTLTMLEASGSTLVATVTLVDSNSAVATQHLQQSPTPTTQRESDSEPSITSIVQVTRTESRYIPSASGTSNLDANGVDVEAGASGSSSSGFSLSRGGMIAIIVVVVCVAVFGGTFGHLLPT